MIENTSTSTKTLLDGMPAAIEASEARGQSQLVSSTKLPVQVHGDRQKLTDAGVVFGEPDERDSLFCEATLPAGWKKVATDHSMWSKLVDADGNEVASIFYKAAFYDRRACIRVN